MVSSNNMNIKGKYIAFVCSLCVMLLAGGCVEEEKPYDVPFVYLTDNYGGIAATMDSEAKYTATYYVRLSSKKRTEDLSIYYGVFTGDGLVEGVDYTLNESTPSPLVFAPDVYEMEIKINWLRHELDYEKDNTLHLTLDSISDSSVTLGRPGFSQLGKEYIITKE